MSGVYQTLVVFGMTAVLWVGLWSLGRYDRKQGKR